MPLRNCAAVIAPLCRRRSITAEHAAAQLRSGADPADAPVRTLLVPRKGRNCAWNLRKVYGWFFYLGENRVQV